MRDSGLRRPHRGGDGLGRPLCARLLQVSVLLPDDDVGVHELAEGVGVALVVPRSGSNVASQRIDRQRAP